MNAVCFQNVPCQNIKKIDSSVAITSQNGLKSRHSMIAIALIRQNFIFSPTKSLALNRESKLDDFFDFFLLNNDESLTFYKLHGIDWNLLETKYSKIQNIYLSVVDSSIEFYNDSKPMSNCDFETSKGLFFNLKSLLFYKRAKYPQNSKFKAQKYRIKMI
jgi:hypothetical protein